MRGSTNTCTVAQALQQAAQSGVARLDAQCLLLHVLGRDEATGRAWLLAHDGDALTHAQHARWLHVLQERADGVPVAYLRGWREFFGLRLAVDARVLDPRADTETLVQWALDVLPQPPAAPRVIDLGTGSGAVACALAHHAPHAHIWASDASDQALAVAQDNARSLGLKLRFAQGDWLDAVHAQLAAPAFDCIVSNPPYICPTDAHLHALRHEPQSALVAAENGLEALRRIIAQAPRWLRSGAWLLLEHGHDQAHGVQHMLAAQGFTQVQGRSDLAGIVRCSGGRFAR